MQKAQLSALLLILLATPALLEEEAVVLPKVDGRVLRWPLKFQGHPSVGNDHPIIPKFKFNFFFTAEMALEQGTNKTTPMALAPNYRAILIPFTGSQGRSNGIPCDENTKKTATCVYNTDLPLQKTLGVDHWAAFDQNPTGFQATNLWNWTKDTNTITTPTKIGALNTSIGNWATGEAGVMGLGSVTGTDNLWTYLFSRYAAENSTMYATFYLTSPNNKGLFWYDVFNGNDTNVNASIFEGSEFRVSDNLTNILDDPTAKGIWIANQGAGNASQTWGIENAALFSTDQKEAIVQNVSVCLAINAHDTFLFRADTYKNFTEKSLDAVCRGAKCGPGSFILNGADALLSVKDHKGKWTNVTVSPGAYLYNDNKSYVQVSAGLVEDYQQYGCDANSQLGLGRMFFYNYQVVFLYTKGGQASAIGFFPYQTRPTLAHFASVYTLVITGLVFVLFLFVCIMALRWKGISEAGDEDEELDHNVYSLAKEGGSGEE